MALSVLVSKRGESGGDGAPDDATIVRRVDVSKLMGRSGEPVVTDERGSAPPSGDVERGEPLVEEATVRLRANDIAQILAESSEGGAEAPSTEEDSPEHLQALLRELRVKYGIKQRSRSAPAGPSSEKPSIPSRSVVAADSEESMAPPDTQSSPAVPGPEKWADPPVAQSLPAASASEELAGQRAGRAGAWSVGLSMLVAIAAGSGGFLLGQWIPLPAERLLPDPVPSLAPAGDQSPLEPDEPLLVRAARGEAEALDEVEDKGEAATGEERLALRTGRLVQEEQKLWRQLAESHASAESVNRLVSRLDEPRFAPSVLAALARLDPPRGPELLYRIATTPSYPDHTRDLAWHALSASDIRKKTPPALRVLVDLKKAETCDEKSAVIPDAQSHGDRRAVALLQALLKPKLGCGPKGKADCHACLRGSSQVNAAIIAAYRRLPPEIPDGNDEN